jgi:hypothetical protein
VTKILKEATLTNVLYIALIGWARFVPGADRLISLLTYNSGKGIAADSARYCYSVWLRHLVMAHRNGLQVPPTVVAELGPGYSIGVGLAALISGASRYYGLDVVKYASDKRNIGVFNELVALFRQRADIPDNNEFPTLEPRLDSYAFPGNILTAELLSLAMAEGRIASLRENLVRIGATRDNPIRYIVPWDDEKVITRESVDMIFSQSVLEHVENLPNAYAAQYLWLKPRGFMSHSIDFKSHGLARRWNGHWQYSRFIWGIIRGKRRYLINRQPFSAHHDLILSIGMKIIGELKTRNDDGLKRNRLAADFRYLSDDDLTCPGVFIQAVKS